MGSFLHGSKRTTTVGILVIFLLLSDKNRHNLISSTNTPNYINFAKRELSFSHV